MTSLRWFGHSAFLIRHENVSVLTDPFFAANPSLAPEAEKGGPDLVLVTHDHGDHVGDAVGICRRTGAKLGAIVETAAKLRSQGVPADQVVGGGFNMGGTIEVKGIQVTMTQAHHSSLSGQPVGYIIRMPDGLTIYHAGDTCLFSGMALWGKLYHIDVALLPIGGFYTMDARQAAMACGLLKCASVVPMHWGTFPVLAQDTKEFERLLATTAPSCTPLCAKVGETLQFNQ